MTVREILRIGHPALREVATPVVPGDVSSARVQGLIDDLIETMVAAHGAGLAAPQIGEPTRIAVLEVRSNPRYPQLPEIPLTILINPVVTVVSPRPLVHFYEGCLSVPGLRGRVTRPGHLRVDALDREGKQMSGEFIGAAASVLQHELDHLDGVLFVDRADLRTLSALPEFDHFVPPEARIVVEVEGA